MSLVEKPFIMRLASSEEKKQKLIREICAICEKQYRKGYQHGVDHTEDGTATGDTAQAFRSEGYNQSYAVVKQPDTGRIEKGAFRVKCELSTSKQEMLTALFDGRFFEI